MRRITKIITGLSLAAGIVASGSAAMAMGDGYHYRSSTSYYYSSPGTTYYEDRAPSTMYYTSPGTTYYDDTSPSTMYYTSPGTTYYHENRAPSTMYYTSPRTSYYETDIYSTPSGVYGYYDNPYNPYWSYRGPLGQGSGHDMRIGR